MEESQVILQDTSLCAIVRDEMMNPAGGIKRFVESHVPYVEQAIIADTGSIDGTREMLEELEARYPNLKIVDIPFRGYGYARNKSLRYVKTRRALILDADELLTHEKPQNDWEVIFNLLNEHGEKNQVYSINFLYVSPEEVLPFNGGHKERIFDMSISPHFPENIWEYLHSDVNFYHIPVSRKDLEIKHFRPSEADVDIKTNAWYNQFVRATEKKKQVNPKIAPSQCIGFPKWKEFNPRRDDYI